MAQNPIEIDFKSAASSTAAYTTLRTFDSYQFSRSILTPAAPFRFTAPGVAIATRQAIRSGDTATLWAVDSQGNRLQIATGFVDETDTHVVPGRVEYVLTGRDTMAQLVDNAAVDASNNIVNVTSVTIDKILGILIQNTRIPPQYYTQLTPNGALLFQTNPGETKINALQRYLEFTNCLIWSLPNGQLVIGKPDFSQTSSGVLSLNSSGQSRNNVVEARVRRSPNLAIRRCVTQLQTLEQVSAGQYTILNADPDVQRIAATNAGRSVYSVFSYGQGGDAVNQVTAVGNQSGNPTAIGAALSKREIARENMKVIDVEIVVKDHVNDNDDPFDIDQMYQVQIEDDSVNEDMYVYEVSYELTLEHGMLTRLKLCRKGTICADSAIIYGGTG